jgi:hypothetical protein
MATHSVSGDSDATLEVEPFAGGRIYERAPNGEEFGWGRVIVWEPPNRLVCEWLVGDTATELEVRFLPVAAEATVVEIEHRGWERFGEAGRDRRDLNDQGWSRVVPNFIRACKVAPH